MLLLSNGQIVTDLWTVIDTDTPESLPQSLTIIPFASLAGLDINTLPEQLGVLFPCDQDIDDLRPYLSHLSLIALVFPTFKDGRAFSQARKIREQLKFTGELRATGGLLPDQYQFLIRTGFSTVLLPDTAHIETWQKSMHDFTEAYQPSVLKEKRLSGLLWKL